MYVQLIPNISEETRVEWNAVSKVSLPQRSTCTKTHNLERVWCCCAVVRRDTPHTNLPYVCRGKMRPLFIAVAEDATATHCGCCAKTV